MCRWFLAQSPAALRKLEEELDAAGLLKTSKNPKPRPFAYADIGKLHWLDGCIKVSPAVHYSPSSLLLSHCPLGLSSCLHQLGPASILSRICRSQTHDLHM